MIYFDSTGTFLHLIWGLENLYSFHLIQRKVPFIASARIETPIKRFIDLDGWEGWQSA